ncbi:23S rRNA (uracil(1939)-C(5))-methyltransferase RlmD [Aliidiomarina halalkaliphila]|uniref:23S rRNA (uracil(1939)-C(5))-methyltransferase RlmD n=1 Tax=Aliidiomarina halalkaliphila TaxID=2593535 RepID=A0A552WZ12_9GAMM|nr:23S rRNA (uracil(1939)-C(5))-methyltransferase RlmD [Aliidiomarina halalkaliphila]TRW47935.1 23S rRNA (uracil(1939)-C(5))-methyltransferase RlmD [Aliidiomarina halalkaliphila]
MASLFDRYQKEKRQKKNKAKQAQSQRQQPAMTTPTSPGLHIERLSHEGRGIAHDAQGKTVFVEGALPGESVTAQITQSRSRYNEAHVVQILQHAPDRVTPRCQHAEVCGGCSLQHMSHNAQVSHKQQVIREHFHHLATHQLIDMAAIQAPALTSAAYGYRRKARLSVTKTKSQGLVVGFRARASKQIIPIQECPILTEALQPMIPALQNFVPQLAGHAHIGHIELIAGDKKNHLVVRVMQPMSLADQKHWRAFSEQHQVQIIVASTPYTEGPLRYQVLHQDAMEPLAYSLEVGERTLTLEFQPGDFVQVNTEVNKRMVAQALDWLNLQPNERVLELFCGFGNFTLPMATQCESVLGVEGSLSQVEQGSKNAQLNQFDNLRFTSADLNQPLNKFSWAKNSFDVVVLDPPRAGAEHVCQQISILAPVRILYVSCDPATLARDAEILVAQGYVLKQWGMLDMFPQTGHMETMSLFVRANDQGD